MASKATKAVATGWYQGLNFSQAPFLP